jgi:TonB family protein
MTTSNFEDQDMKPASVYSIRKRISVIGSIVVVLTTLSTVAFGQSSELTLADLLIGLRSKKATLEQRNSILTEAIADRGVTFSLTPEIEKELLSTGATKALIDSIRKKTQVVKIASVGGTNTMPVVPPPPDSAFYEKRAETNAGLGRMEQAIADYSKAIEMDPKAYLSFLGRGGVYSSMKSFDTAIADFTQVIENLPKNTNALASRGFAYESTSKFELAESDYAKAADLEPENENAKAGLMRVRAEIKKIAEKAKPVPAPPVEVKALPKPEFVAAGTLTEANAVRMVKPIYSQFASRSNISGKVVVEVTLDESGNVTEAKAVSGPQMLRSDSEDAARRSKFKPFLFENVPMKAKGTITYNFVAKQ